jgi:hypothetical protein
MQIIVLGGNGRLLAALAAATVAYGHMGLPLVVPGRGASKRTAAEIIAIDECERFNDYAVKQVQVQDESPHPGERHRETVKRVNSGRSRAGKAARWQ